MFSPGGSIQAAVDKASSGDTILVKPGEYKESVQINEDNLTIISDSKIPIILLLSERIKRTTHST